MKSIKQVIQVGLVLLLFFGCRPEDKLEPTAVDTYVKLIGDPDYPLIAVDARKDNAGNTVLLANVESESDGVFLFTPMIIRIDGNGNVIGEKEGLFNSEREIEQSMISHSLTVVNNDNYLIVGELINDDAISEIAVVTYSTSLGFNGPFTIDTGDTDGNGDPIYAKGRGKAIEIMSDGNYFIVAESVDNPTTNLTFNIDKSFDNTAQTATVISNSTFTDSKSMIINRLYKNINGLMLWAGPFQNSTKAQVTGMVPSKDLPEFGENLPLNGETIAVSAFLSYAGKNIIAGVVPDGDQTAIQLYSYTSTGIPKVLPDISLLSREGNELPVSITPSSGGFAILAITEEGNGEEDFVLINILETGTGLELDFMQSFGGENSDLAKAVVQDADGGFVMFGTTDFSDVNTLLLIKCSEKGEL